MRRLPFALLICLFAPLGAAADGDSRAPGLDDVLAVVDGRPIESAELDAFIGNEYRFEPRARELLDLMIQQRIIELDARRRGVEVQQDQLEQRLRTLEAETTRRTDGQQDLRAVFEEHGVARDEFLNALRTTLLAESLARLEFDIPVGTEVPYEKTNLWIQDRLARSTVRRHDLAMNEVARVDGEPITCAELGARYLADQKARRGEWLAELIDYQVVLNAARKRRVEPDQETIQEALRQRDERVRSDPRYAGATLQELLERSGRSLDWFQNSMRFRGQVLIEQLVELEYPGDRLEQYHRDRIEEFDRLFGPAVRLRAMFLRAGHEGAFSQRFVPRLYADAEAELEAIKQRIDGHEARLEDIVTNRSEHPSRDKAGDLGFIRESHASLGPLARAALEQTDRDHPDAVLGPIRTAEGVFLIREIGRQPKPGFAEIRAEVREHAARTLFDSLKAEAVIEHVQ